MLTYFMENKLGSRHEMQSENKTEEIKKNNNLKPGVAFNYYLIIRTLLNADLEKKEDGSVDANGFRSTH